jgi:hypothetical protein
MDIKHNRAETNGVRLHYITAGSGPIVLCLPGSHVSDRGALRRVRPARRPGKTIRIMSPVRGRQVSISWGLARQ